jgi:type IV pilus assembly protein PilY1
MFLLATLAAFTGQSAAAMKEIDIAAMCGAFSEVANAAGSLGNVAVSGTTITSDGVHVYQPGFNSFRWSGSMKRFRLVLDDTGIARIAGTADWDAGELLTGTGTSEANPSPDARRIYTSKIKADHALATIDFKWDDLSREQQHQLDASPIDGKRDGFGSRRLAYLRGARTLEKGHPGGVFRIRDRVLGDIVNSSPVYVGAPSLSVRGSGYDVFYSEYKNRTRAVYVGANDGMLHAFDASDGHELFAYVPNALISRLNSLTSPEYVHRPFVDGGLTVVEAKMNGRWRTVLASSMGGGARGVFALDVTNPADFTGGLGALWEFTDTDDADMGNLMGAPVIAKFQTGQSNGVPQYRYFAVVSSGLNNTTSDGHGRLDAGASGVLFLLALDKPATEHWHEGHNYYKFKVPVTDVASANGLSMPALAIGGDGAVRYVYAGDLQGNLWRFDFTGTAPWAHAIGASPEPLFIASDANNVRQPITLQPKVVFAPGGGYVVLFGTGRFLESADAAPGNFRQQSFYAILDRDGNRVAGRDRLAARTAAKSGSGDIVDISGPAFDYGTSGKARQGWYLDFLDAERTGERSVTAPLIAYGRLFFNTLIPDAATCATGHGRSYALDALTGLPVGGMVSGALPAIGMLGPPKLFEMVDAGDRHVTRSRTVARKYSIFNFGAGGINGTAAPMSDGAGSVNLSSGRFSWREIVNWQELRRTAGKK